MLILTRFQDYYLEMLTSARISVAFLLVGLLTWDVGLPSSSSSLSLLSLNLFWILWAPKYVLKLSKNNTLVQRTEYMVYRCMLQLFAQLIDN